jgi:hypothetical protein
MSGAFIDCNHLFCLLSKYTKQEVCALTIFNVTARDDLQHAFDLISQMISPPMDDGAHHHQLKHVALRGSFRHRDDLGLCISLVKGEDGISKCFCVTLIKNPSSPFDMSEPKPVSFDAVPPVDAVFVESSKKQDAKITAVPAFTSG